MKKILTFVCTALLLMPFGADAQTVERLDSIVSDSSKTIYQWSDAGDKLAKTTIVKTDAGWQKTEDEHHKYDASHNETFAEYCTYSNGEISFGQRTEYTYEGKDAVMFLYYMWENGEWQKTTYLYNTTLGDTLHVYRKIGYSDGEVSSGYGYDEVVRDNGSYLEVLSTTYYDYVDGEWIPAQYAHRRTDAQDFQYKSECTYDSLGRMDEEQFYYRSSDDEWKLHGRDKYVYTDMPIDSIYAVYHYRMQQNFDHERVEELDYADYYVYEDKSPFASLYPGDTYREVRVQFHPENASVSYGLYAIGDCKFAVGTYTYNYSTLFESIMLYKRNRVAQNHEDGGELVTTVYSHLVTTRDTLTTAAVWKDYWGPKILYVVSLDEQGNELSRDDYYYTDVTAAAIAGMPQQQAASSGPCYDLTGRRIADPSSHHGFIIRNVDGKLRKMYQR